MKIFLGFKQFLGFLISSFSYFRISLLYYFFVTVCKGTNSDAIELLMPMSPLVALFGVGGLELFLSLIEQAETVDTLKDALNCFGCAIKLSKKLSTEVDSQAGFRNYLSKNSKIEYSEGPFFAPKKYRKSGKKRVHAKKWAFCAKKGHTRISVITHWFHIKLWICRVLLFRNIQSSLSSRTSV